MKLLKVSRKLHKWLMLFIGIQFLFWSITGLYMVSMDIHYIHGESLQDKKSQKLNLNKVSYSINALLQAYPDAKAIKLVKFMGLQVYHFTVEEDKLVINATTGKRLPLVDQESAKNIANYYYSGAEDIASNKLISSAKNMPAELSPRHLPVWQVTFNHFAQPTFYISQQTGAIVTKRHDYWRLFDWMWRFHIMDYDDGENVANWFLFVVALFGCLAALTGAVLTYFRVIRSKNQGAL